MGLKNEDATGVLQKLSGLERRDFLKAAAAVAATGAITPSTLLAGQPGGAVAVTRQERQEVPLVPLGNGEPPALQFQAYPGGTGALMEKLWREHGGSPFERTPIEVEPWRGPVPTDETDIAFLPVHRLAALIRDRRISSVELTEIYLDRARRGIDGEAASPWYFPTPEEYRARLEAAGFEVETIALIPRPTVLPGKMEAWLETFGEAFLHAMPEEDRPVILSEVTEAVRPALFEPEGRWIADYVRLRFYARKSATA